MRISPAWAALIFAAGCAGAPQVADREFLLTYGGNPGEVSSYVAEQTLRGRVSMQGMPQLVAVKTRSEIGQTVMEVLENGRRRIAVKYGIVRLEINGAEIEIDEAWKAMKGEFLRGPSGVIEEENEAGSSEEMLAWIARGLETFFPVFPEKPVRVGERWIHSSRSGEDRGQMATKMSVTFLKVEEIEGVSCAVLELEGSIRGSGSGAEEGVGELDLEYSGVAHFDVVSGRLVRARQKGGFRTQAKAQGVDVGARLNFMAEIRLATNP